MYLTGCVKDSEQMWRSDREKFFVCIQFDRGCITSTMCSCMSDSNWCVHVIALCIARIRGAVHCDVHPPLGEMLNQFNRDQLQKMIQHFVDKLPLVGIPPMVAMVTKLRDKGSSMNQQNGAPGLFSWHTLLVHGYAPRLLSSVVSCTLLNLASES